jgi:hypothetical protein
VVFTVVTRLELPKLGSEVHRIDPRAFIVRHQGSPTPPADAQEAPTALAGTGQ